MDVAEQRLIDANALEIILKAQADIVALCERPEIAGGFLQALDFVKKTPTIDAEPVVRCRECKHSECIFTAHFVGCGMWKHPTPKNGYCHMGEKMYGGASDA